MSEHDTALAQVSHRVQGNDDSEPPLLGEVLTAWPGVWLGTWP
jgi:hypothetical protein